jgi:mRNA-degrading endonuclease toxin of MazEF toxin-antitoxin module
VPQILQGSIIRATVTDTRGQNPKTRPLVVVTGNAELSQTDSILCVAVTGEFDNPLLPNEILLPWHPRGKCRTRLKKKSVAKCSWVCEIRHSDVLEIKGHCPPAELELILEQIGKLPP